MQRATRIAMLARLYMLLSDRPELMCVDREELVERMLSVRIPLSELDKTLILHADELDRVCAHAVRVLLHVSDKPLLDALGMMEPDRIVAVYYTLPPKRRVFVLRDPVWAHAVGNAPPETGAAVAELAEAAESDQALTADRTRVGANEPALKSARQRMEAYERAALRDDAEPVERVLAVFGEELASLPANPDDEAFAAACARAVERCS